MERRWRDGEDGEDGARDGAKDGVVVVVVVVLWCCCNCSCSRCCNCSCCCNYCIVVHVGGGKCFSLEVDSLYGGGNFILSGGNNILSGDNFISCCASCVSALPRTPTLIINSDHINN
jgi:hypothetical protein